MRRESVVNLKPGMVIARSIYGVDGRPLLIENTELNDIYIARLSKIDIGSVYIKDGLDDVEIPEIVSRQVLSSLSLSLDRSLKSFSAGKELDVNTLKRSVSSLLKDIIDNRNVLFQLDDIRCHSDYLFFHSINVAMFSLMTGLSLGYTEGNLVDLGLGALMHDLGMTVVNPTIINKTEPLSIEEHQQIERHAETGFNMLRAYRDLSVKSAHIAFQHHERMDGTGYPRGLAGKDILDFAKIVAIADTFDAVVSDRPYRAGYSTSDALTILRRLAANKFDPEIVEAFASNVAVYPVGCLIMLNTGHIAIVTAVDKNNASRPTVNVICDNNKNFLKPALEIKLLSTEKVSIVKRLSNEETDAVRSQILNQKHSASN